MVDKKHERIICNIFLILVFNWQMSEDTWVQCENPRCLKWRRILALGRETLSQDGVWYCFMNRDEKYNTCTDPQVSELVLVKYVPLTLNLTSLLLVMPNYGQTLIFSMKKKFMKKISPQRPEMSSIYGKIQMTRVLFIESPLYIF